MESIKMTGYRGARVLLVQHRSHLIAIFLLIGGFLSITQILGISRDYLNYVEFFDLVRGVGAGIFVESRFEPGFSLLTLLLTSVFSSDLVVYSFFVLASLLLKGWLISFNSSSQRIFLVAAVFYFVRYFPLHELTQLRIALGISFVMWAAIRYWDGKYKSAALLGVAAMLFHMSVIAILPGLLFSSTKRWKVILVGVITFAVTFLIAGVLTRYLSAYIQILSAYDTNGAFNDSTPNPLAVYLLIDIAMIAVSLALWPRLSSAMQRIVALQIVGLAVFYGSFDFSVIAIRVRELYSVFWVIFVAHGLRKQGMAWITWGFVSVCCIFYFYLFFLFQEIPFFSAA